jgi:lysozyme
MNISDEGIDFIMAHEGCRLVAYPDPGTGGEPWTIGVGHTGGVQAEDTCTEDQAREWLRIDAGTAVRCVNNSVKVILTQSQFDALVSLVFNIGCGNFGKSTLLRCLNDGDEASAAQEFLKWDRAAGREMAGLLARRTDEMNLFLT